MNLRQGIVVGVHPEDHSVDLVMLDDGARLVGVQVMTGNGSARTGTFDMPAVGERRDKWDITQKTDQDQIAIVAYAGRNPIVIGYLFPQISQMTFKDGKRMVYRHQSDVTVSIEETGAMYVRHPGGFQFKVGTPDNDKSGDDNSFDKNREVTRNKTMKPTMQISIAGQDSKTQFSIHVAQDGVISIFSKKKIRFWSESDLNITAKKVIMDTEQLFVTGDVKTKKGVSMNDHKHGGVVPGPAESDKATTSSSGNPSTDGMTTWFQVSL